MKKIAVTIILCCLILHVKTHAQQQFNILDYGAVPGNQINNATAIQAAVNAAAKAGGGVVIIPAGKFMTGTVELQSNVEVHLEQGAVISGSDKRKDYEGFGHLSLLIATGKHHIAITGNGTIDGRGRLVIQDIMKRLQEGSLTDPEWKVKRPREASRTNLIYFEACDNVKVSGVVLKDASAWVTHYERCRNVHIDGIHLESTAYWNNDGIDIVDCKNFKVTRSFINAADDAICLKSVSENDYCDSIYIADCTLRSSANAFKLGTSSKGGFKNITVRNIKVFDTYRSAIALEAVDGGFIKNVDIKGVHATNTGNAVFIKLGHRNNDERWSEIKNIHIRNVTAEVPAGKPDAGYETEGPLLKYPPGIVPVNGKPISVSPWNRAADDTTSILYRHNVFPSSFCGLSGHPVQDIVLENITVVFKTKADSAINHMPLDSFNIITEATKDYPEFSMFGELPVWGFYMRHASGVVMKNVTLRMAGSDYRKAFLFNDVKDLRQEKIQVSGNTPLPYFFYHATTIQKR